jgi:hypothetical protein
VFALPKDIPDRRWGGSDFISDKIIRSLSYVIGKNEIFAFGGGTLFALEPRTGKLLWRHAISDDPVVRNNAVSIDSAEMIEGEGQLFLISGSTMVRFDRKSNSTVAVLRKNLCEGPLPIVVGGSLYCFTQRP